MLPVTEPLILYNDDNAILKLTLFRQSHMVIQILMLKLPTHRCQRVQYYIINSFTNLLSQETDANRKF